MIVDFIVVYDIDKFTCQSGGDICRFRNGLAHSSVLVRSAHAVIVGRKVKARMGRIKASLEGRKGILKNTRNVRKRAVAFCWGQQAGESRLGAFGLVVIGLKGQVSSGSTETRIGRAFWCFIITPILAGQSCRGPKGRQTPDTAFALLRTVWCHRVIDRIQFLAAFVKNRKMKATMVSEIGSRIKTSSA